MIEIEQRDPPLVLPALREVVRGAPCTFRIPGVQHASFETSCWCHSNESRHGKGVGQKAHDIFGAIGCANCHNWYDLESRRVASAPSFMQATAQIRDSETRRMIFDDAHIRSLKWLLRQGYMAIIRNPTYAVHLPPGDRDAEIK